MIDACKIVASQFPDLPVPKYLMPNVFLYAAPLFDKRITLHWVRNNLDYIYEVDNSRVYTRIFYNSNLNN